MTPCLSWLYLWSLFLPVCCHLLNLIWTTMVLLSSLWKWFLETVLINLTHNYDLAIYKIQVILYDQTFNWMPRLFLRFWMAFSLTTLKSQLHKRRHAPLQAGPDTNTKFFRKERAMLRTQEIQPSITILSQQWIKCSIPEKSTLWNVQCLLSGLFAGCSTANKPLCILKSWMSLVITDVRLHYL